ncbi:ComEC family competence protein [Patescibacteria group bacterium]|nr:ComEC family competence protein [Patescibacteria group bacterium]
MTLVQPKIRSLFYFLIIGFISGVFFRSFFNLGDYFLLFLFVLSLFLFTLHWFFKRKNTENKEMKFILSSFFILLFILGVFRYDISDQYKGNSILDRLVEQKVVAEGIIINEPIEKDKNTKFIIKLRKVMFENNKVELEDRILIITESPSFFNYGDVVLIGGILNKPKNFITEGKKFDYVSYLSKDRIFYQMFYPRIERESSNEGNYIKQNLFKLKNSFLKSIKRTISEPHSSLLGGLTVGAEESLGEALQENFRKTGIMHIVVLSGYNVTIVSEAIMRVFSFLPFVFKFSFGIISIIFFVLMTGASATAVRAGIMAIFVIIARITGREYEALRALFIAGVFMIIQNPKILAFDSSFQLSFMATLGLLYVSPKIYRYFKFITTKFQFRELVVSVIATQLFVLPLILYKMGYLSLLALPVNLLILPFIPITMFFGFVSGVLGFLSSAISFPVSFLTFILLDYELKIVNFFADLPFSSIQINNFPLILMILIYIIYGIVLFFVNKRTRVKNDK